MKSMKWILVRLGIAMSVFAFVALMVIVVLPAVVPIANLPLVQSIVQVTFCKPGEKLSTTYSTYETPGTTSTSADMQCANSDGQGRDISDDFFKFVFIGYLVTFLGGFVLIGIGQYLPAQQTTPTPSAVPESTPHSDSTFYHENAGGEGHAHKHSSGSQAAASHGQSLTHRLSELKSALDAGLITQAEYDAKREELLKEA